MKKSRRVKAGGRKSALRRKAKRCGVPMMVGVRVKGTRKTIVFTFLVWASVMWCSLAWATTYYVSSSTGNDVNSGTASGAAWQTIGHVNGQTFLPGDLILFKRGDVWNESLTPPSAGSAGSPITFDAYGSGAAPNFTGYYAVPSTAWVLVAGNAWKAALPAGYTTINFCLFGSIWGQKVAAVSSNLTAQWDFYLANGFIYVYSQGNPSSYYNEAIVPMALSNVPVINVNGKSWLTFQHFLVNWFDQYGVYVQGASDHLVFANMEADSMIPQGTQPLGFYVNEVGAGPGDIKIYNSEAHLNYDGFRFDGAATAIAMVNDKAYANRDGALVDNTGAVTYSYCHFYASSLAVAGSTDVEWTSGTGPIAGAGNIAADTAPAVQVYQRYPAEVTLTVDDAGMTPGADTYYASTVLPLADAAGVPVGVAITVGYPLANTLVAEFQGWVNAGRDVTSHSMSHTYYTNTDALEIQYTGSGTAATLSIASKTLTITVTGASDSVSYNLAQGQPQGTILGLQQALAATGKFTTSYLTPCQGPYGTGCSAYTGQALLAQDLADVSGQNVKSSVYHMLLDVTRLTTDEITLSRGWMTTYLTGLPATPVYVYPGGYETTTMQGITAGVPYTGARGALKEDLGVFDTYADGFNLQNITSFGVNPSWQNLTAASLNQKIQALVWKEMVWGVPWGIFWHLNELSSTEITNLIQDLKTNGATVQTNTGLVNWLRGGTQESGTDGNYYYKLPATSMMLDFRPTKNSPVVNAGQNLGAAYAIDINGINQNSYGSGWEIGAHVYQGFSTYGGQTGSYFKVGMVVSPVAGATLFGFTETGTAASNWPTVSYGMQRFWDSPPLQWPSLNTAAGVFSFSNLDTDLAQAFSIGVMEGMYTLARTPTWASSAPGDASCNYTGSGSGLGNGECDPPNDLNSDGSGANAIWKAWITAIASHVNDPTYLQTHAHIQYWEIWNEPDNGGFWRGSIAQLARLTEDANCIITGRGVIHQSGNGSATPCTASPIDPTAKIVMASAHAMTPALTYGQNELYCNAAPTGSQLPCPNPGNAIASAVDIVNFHMKPGNETGNTCPAPIPCTPESAMEMYVSNIEGILQPAERSKPLWDGEAAYSTVGFSNAYTDTDMAASFMPRFYLTSWSLGISGMAWYTWDELEAEPAAVQTSYQQTYSWLAGSSLTTSCGAVGTVWSCGITKSGNTYQVIWDTAQSCSGGSCTTANQSVGNQWTTYWDMTTASAAKVITGHSVPVGIKPVVLAALCGPPLYSCSSSSSAVAQTPAPPAALTGTTGYNQIGYDTSLNAAGINPITRFTDSTMLANNSPSPTPSQGDNDVASNCAQRGVTPGSTYTSAACANATTYLLLAQAGGCSYAYGVQKTPAGLQVVSPLPATLSHTTTCGSGAFAHTDPWTMYSTPGSGTPTIYKTVWAWDGTAGHTLTWTQTALYSLQSLCPLPGSFVTTWASSVSTDISDKYFTVGLSNAGGQNTGNFMVFLDTTSSPNTCVVYNTGDPAHGSTTAPFGTQTCSGPNCPTGSFTPGCQFTIHDVFSLQNAASGSGYVPLSTGGQTTGATCVTNKPVWQPYGPGLVQCSVTGTIGGKVCTGGHYSTGYNNISIANNPYLFSFPAANAASGTPLAPFATLNGNCENHFSNSNADVLDSNPIVSSSANNNFSSSSSGSSWTLSGQNEVNIVFPSAIGMRLGGTILRVTHNFILGPGNGVGCGNANVGPFDSNANFSAQYAIGDVTQDGSFFWWSSSMLGQLGTDTNGNTASAIFGVRLD
jgi:hypothetical protein